MRIILKLLGILIFASGAMSVVNGLLGSMMVSVVFGGLLVALGVFLFRKGGRLGDAGFAEGYAYAFHSGGTGIAISPDRRVLKLKKGRASKEYAFSDVRAWEGTLQSGGMAVHGGSGFTGATNVAAANLGQTLANRRASGLFVQVRDIDNPEWRVAMLDKREQAKWMEILRQYINEA